MLLMPREGLSRVRTLVAAEHLAFVVDAMAAGNTAARAWVDDLLAPRAALIWDLGHAVYLVGRIDEARSWRRVFDEQVAATNPGFLKVHLTQSVADSVFAGWPLQERARVLYRGSTAPAVPPSLRLPDGFRISAINDRFDQLCRLDNFDHVLAEIRSCWPSVRAFRQSGFGYIAHDANQVVCWCTAECVSQRACGIGIETLPAYQRRGFATMTAGAFLQHCADRGIVAHWDAWADNRPSTRVAEKIGLARVERYSIFVGAFEDVPPPRG